MFRALVSLVSAAGLAAATLTLTTAPAQAAVRPQAATLVKTVTLDMDGDAKPDTLRFYELTETIWKAKVTTATGKTASKTFTTAIVHDWGLPSPWGGAARLDGVRGYEVKVLITGGDGATERMLTWRSGKLVWEKAPASPWAMGGWYEGGPDGFGHGYAFFTSLGKHYVNTYGLTKTASGRYKGTVLRSKWVSGKWVKVEKIRVNLSKAQFDTELKDQAVWIN
jgi:hypothetical protein